MLVELKLVSLLVSYVEYGCSSTAKPLQEWWLQFFTWNEHSCSSNPEECPGWRGDCCRLCCREIWKCSYYNLSGKLKAKCLLCVGIKYSKGPNVWLKTCPFKSVTDLVFVVFCKDRRLPSILSSLVSKLIAFPVAFLGENWPNSDLLV